MRGGGLFSIHFKEDLRKILKDPPNLADMLANSPPRDQ